MNEADFPSINLDELRLVPDWMREDAPPPSKQYAGHDHPVDDSRGQNRGPRRADAPFNRDRRDSRGGSPAGGNRDGRGRQERRPGGPPQRGGGSPFRDDRRPRETPPAPVVAAPVTIEFLPDERCLASIIKQIRSTHLAYPLFSLARMFLQEPARHLVQFTLEPAAAQAGTSLHQLGEDGPITLDRQALERIAFDSSRERFYREETVQKDPLKGNFLNVARCRLSGTLLGPTNYHGYQPALRSLYESRFSRRMSFEDYRREIEVSTDPALVEKWKEDARTTTTIVTTEGEPPTVLQSLNDARAHFKQHYFDGLLRSGTILRVHGSVARNLPEAAMMQAIRQAHERELRYPAQFVQQLRQGLQNNGLHIFKHRKRIVYVSLARPTPFIAGSGAVSENVATILATIGQFPLCSRKVLAAKVLGQNAPAKMTAPAAPAAPVIDIAAVAAAPEVAVEDRSGGGVSPDHADSTGGSGGDSFEQTGDAGAVAANLQAPAIIPAPVQAPVVAPAEDPAARSKAALASDLRFLVQAGHIIEFHNGTFDLPLPPKPKEEASASQPSAGQKRSPREVADEVGADPAAESSGSGASGRTSDESLPEAGAVGEEASGVESPGVSIASERDLSAEPGVALDSGAEASSVDFTAPDQALSNEPSSPVWQAAKDTQSTGEDESVEPVLGEDASVEPVGSATDEKEPALEPTSELRTTSH